MKVVVKVVGREPKEVEVSGDRVKVKELMHELGLLSEEYIVMRSGKVLTDEDDVFDGDELVFVPVVSGG